MKTTLNYTSCCFSYCFIFCLLVKLQLHNAIIQSLHLLIASTVINLMMPLSSEAGFLLQHYIWRGRTQALKVKSRTAGILGVF